MTVTPGATQAATVVDEWVRCGLRHAVICPGSRSTPLATAFWTHPQVTGHVHVDERSAAFAALGIGRATGTPAAVVTTSGTAAVELHPAVVEADHAGVPLLACTADRPPEMRGRGAPQTIDQRALFGVSARGFFDVAVARDEEQGWWRAVAREAWIRATWTDPGPVQVNAAFAEPLSGSPDQLPAPHPVVDADAAPAPVDGQAVAAAAASLTGRGVLVVGADCGDADLIAAVAQRLGWPVLADPLSGCRGRGFAVVTTADALARDESVRRDLAPEAVLWLGRRPASRVVGEWLGAAPVQVAASVGFAPDPDALVDHRLPGGAAALLTTLGGAPGPTSPAWAARWQRADRLARAVIDEELTRHPQTEPAIATTVATGRPASSVLVVSSSMPIRDVEWYASRCDGPVMANRGANGIDGVVSTAVGVALSGRPTVALVGDLAFLHDSNGLLGLADRGVDLTIVVVDNDGGSIFSMLPQAEILDPETFRALFTTPHGLDLVAVARSLGVTADHVAVEALADVGPPAGARVLVVSTDGAESHATRQRIHERVAAAVTAP